MPCRIVIKSMVKIAWSTNITRCDKQGCVITVVEAAAPPRPVWKVGGVIKLGM